MSLFSMNATGIHSRCKAAKRQAGVALVMALVILFILTIIGVAAMSTSALEEKMAGNIQETIRVLQGAESALNKSLNTTGSLNLYTTQTFGPWDFGGATTNVTIGFKEYSPPSRGSGYSRTSFDAANFDQTSTSTISGSGARSAIHRGTAQIVPKS